LLAEDLHADDVLLQFVAAPGRSLRHDERDEALQTLDLLERDAREYPVQLLANGLRGRLAGRRRSGPQGHRSDYRAVGCNGSGTVTFVPTALHPPRSGS